jgi:hypothetical protein
MKAGMRMITVSHVVYGLVTLAVIVVMLMRKGVVIPTLLGTLLVGWIYKGDIISGFKAVYNANLLAATELFTIFLIITFMVALLSSLKDIGADRLMIQPIGKLMVNGHVSFFIMCAVTFVISLFFWPTPAVPLIGALLIPAAARAGLPAMGAAMAIAISGQGMALSSDYIMQVAPMLSATSAGVSTAEVADKGLVLSLIAGVVAIGLAYLVNRKSIAKPGTMEETALLTAGKSAGASSGERMPEAALAAETIDPSMRKWARAFAVIVPAAMLAIMIIMILSKVTDGAIGSMEGGDGAAFIGGVAVILLVLASTVFSKVQALDKISEHLIEGFVFAFKAMGPVIPIAGFFFLGNSDFSGRILSLGADEAPPAFLFDMVTKAQEVIPTNGFIAAFGLLIIGIITGLDGSGFSGLPLTGSLSGALAAGSGVDASTLAAIGQMGAIWSGGGALIAWSSLVAVAGFAGVSALDLARKNFIPVIAGLIVSTLFAIIFW